MNGLPYYKAYPRDFIEGTIGMPFELKGCYRLVLDLIYMQGGNLPDDARYISGLLGCSIRAWKNMRNELVLLDKLQVSGEFLTNYRAVSELETYEKEKNSKPKSRPAIPLAVRYAVFERDGFVCTYCGTTDATFHLDHIFPWSKGGPHSEDNLTVACAACNFSKRDKTLEEWLQ